MFPQKLIVLKPWLPADGLLKQLDYEDFNFISGLVHWWGRNLLAYWEVMKTGDGAQLREWITGAEPDCFLSNLSPSLLPGALFHHAFCLPQAHSTGTGWLGTETSEIMSQK